MAKNPLRALLRLPAALYSRISIGGRLTIAAIAFASLALGASLYVTVRDADAELHRQGMARLDANMRVAWEMLRMRGTEYRLSGETLLAGEKVLNGDNETVDKVKAAVGGVATIFMGDLRVATNIQRPDGTRAVGTKLAPGLAFDAVMRENRAYRGPNTILNQPYFTAYDPIKDPSGKTIGILFIGIPEAEFLAATRQILTNAAMTGGGVLLVAAVLVWLTVRRSLRPLGAMGAAMDRIAAGDTACEVPGSGRHDEIGRMAGALAVFRDRIAENARIAAERAAADQRSAEERRALRTQMAEELDRTVRGVAEELSQAGRHLSGAVGALRETADDTRTRAGEVAVAAGETTSNVQSVATATDQLAEATRAIAQRVSDSAAAASAAVAQADSTNETVSALAASAGKIGDVVKLINDIAGQTNLLALNATIEAARAGDAGKGFAVVASEVKNLATQTARATEDISRQVGEIQAATRRAVGDIQSIGQAIRSIHGTATEIAGAVEQQGGATAEIATNVQSAARGTRSMAETIRHVTDAAEKTGMAVGPLGEAAQSVSAQSDRLKSEVEEFVSRMRAS